ncbi:phospholipase-like protein [Artemisia annua]|uniref:Phospholipase-like protein n=1 Tax=Artemisia annua TaxID=35608 RepID=A0A2U1M1V6_ARTAN|nr:phospholipase-like protein [Artemisia annua]
MPLELNLDELFAGILTTRSARKDDQIASPVSRQLGGKILKSCAAPLNEPQVKRVLISDSESEVEHEKIKPSSIDPRMPSKSDFMCKYNQMPVKLDLDELFAGILTKRAKKDDQVKRVLISLDSESEEEHENRKPSSIDPPMPSKSVKEWNGKRKRNKKQIIPFAGGRMGRRTQPVEHGENLVGKRIKVWWAADSSYRQGVVKSFDRVYNSHKMHKVSFDDGDEEILELKWERWELVEKVSPNWDSVGVAVPGKVSSSQSDMICVQGYKVKNINAPILESIFRSHGDIAAKCVFTDAVVRTSLLEAICEIARRIKTNDVTNIISKMEEIESQVSAAEASKINVSWLQPHLETIRKRNEAQKNKTLLMEMKKNTTLIKMAAKTDLKERCDEFVAASNRLVKANKCVKVLELVEKKLTNDVLEFKAEKDLFVGQPILYAD